MTALNVNYENQWLICCELCKDKRKFKYEPVGAIFLVFRARYQVWRRESNQSRVNKVVVMKAKPYRESFTSERTKEVGKDD
jgi:hypothetical protein